MPQTSLKPQPTKPKTYLDLTVTVEYETGPDPAAGRQGGVMVLLFIVLLSSRYLLPGAQQQSPKRATSCV